MTNYTLHCLERANGSLNFFDQMGNIYSLLALSGDFSLRSIELVYSVNGLPCNRKIFAPTLEHSYSVVYKGFHFRGRLKIT
jgi:hypothetical protein